MFFSWARKRKVAKLLIATNLNTNDMVMSVIQPIVSPLGKVIPTCCSGQESEVSL